MDTGNWSTTSPERQRVDCLAAPAQGRDRMSPGWLDDVARFAAVMEATQQELLEALRLKRRALVSGSAEEMQRLVAVAQDAAGRLRQLTVWRGQLLDQAHAEGSRAETLTDVLAESAHPAQEHLRARFAAVQQRFGEAQRESWIQWIIAQRAGLYYTEMLELLAQGGERTATYQETNDPAATAGGVVLDAAV